MFVAFVQLYMENILNYGFIELCIFKQPCSGLMVT